MKEYRFFLHYNKPLSKQRNEHFWSVHYKGQCYMTKNIKCLVQTESKVNKRQPYVVMRGYAKQIEIDGEELIIS